MSEKNDALYRRGKYRLAWDRRQDGSLRTPFLQILWYDPATGRNRSRSTGTANVQAAEAALDRFYLQHERGQAICNACGQAIANAKGYLVTQAIADYLIAKEDVASIGSLRPRLAHIIDFISQTNRIAITCDQINGTWVEQFRKWAANVPVKAGKTTRDRSPGTIEGSVGALAAAINFAHERGHTVRRAGFTALSASAVSRTPTYRSPVSELAKMFEYCLRPVAPAGETWSEKMTARQVLYRAATLRFLQASVATWARPDAVHDISTDPARGQWIPAARVLRLNPKGRRQTKKYRPDVPVPAKFARLLDECDGFFVPVGSVRKAFEAMLDELGLPRERETGVKLIRRSVAQIARGIIGEAQWAQGQIMLGHQKASTSDLYALFDPANLGIALNATETIIDQIEAECSGAFTGLTPELRIIAGGRAS